MKTLAKLTLALLAAGITTSSQAATVNLSVDVNLSDVYFSTGFVMWRPDSQIWNWDFSFNQGDTVNLTYQFLNGKALRLTNTDAATDTRIQVFVEHVPIGNSVGNVQFSNPSIALTGVQGSGLSSSYNSSYTSNGATVSGIYNTCCHGYNWVTADALLPGADITFTGLTASFTQVSGGTWGTFFPDFFIQNGNVVASIVDAPAAPSAPVPTPATLPLLGLGAAAMFVRSRKNRKA